MNQYYKKLIFTLFLLVSIQVFGNQGFLTDEDIALYYKQGYLLKPKCLTQEEIAQLNVNLCKAIDQSLEEIKNSPTPVFSDKDQTIFIDGSRIVFKKYSDQAISVKRINGCSGMQPALLATVRSEKMVHTFFELLGTTDLEHLISQIHPKLPGDGVLYARHRDIQFRKSFDPDWQDILGNGSYSVCIIPVDPMNQENGGLWIDRNNYPEPQGLPEDLVWIHAEPGDLLFMHPNLYHGSEPNASTASRKTLLTGFCAFGANHRAYPGAHVNTRVTLTDNGSISTTPSPWSEGPCSGSTAGH